MNNNQDILSLMNTEEGRREFKRLLDERIPKIEALREKFGYYILEEHPEALERFEELMKDDIPEPFNTIAKERLIDEYIRQGEGSLKHEGMYLTHEDKELIKRNLKGEITKEEFIKIACEQAKEEAETMRSRD